MSVDLGELELAEETTPELTEGERNLLMYLRFGAARARQQVADRGGAAPVHRSVFELVLKHGRLFTPAPRPADITAGQHWEDVHRLVDRRPDELVYVEGFSTSAQMGWMALEHAWCARVPGGVAALDTLWSPIGGAYVGVPLPHQVRGPHDVRAPQIFGTNTLFGRHLLRHGLCPDAVVPGVGRPIPAAAQLPDLTD